MKGGEMPLKVNIFIKLREIGPKCHHLEKESGLV